jgi:hypothetical protein
VRGALDDSAAGPRTVVSGVATFRWSSSRPAMSDGTALVRPIDSVVDGRPAIATSPTPAQLGVELLQRPRGDLADRLVTEGGVQVEPGVALVALPGRLLEFVHPQPRLHGRAEGGLRPRVALLVDLRTEPLQDPPRLGLVGGRLRQAKFLARQRWPNETAGQRVVETRGIEPLTPALQMNQESGGRDFGRCPPGRSGFL